jgi:acyl-CoA reductase-like NAD-dependent aldehyde dehydrogenase
VIQRIYVHEDVYDAFVPAYVAEVKKYVLGDPAHERTTLGPVVSVAAAAKIRAQVEDAVKAGATAHVPPELFPAAKECVQFLACE